MALIDVYNASQDADFQGRCLAAAWTTAQRVLDNATDYDTSTQSKNYALKMLRQQQVVSAAQIAVQVLRNAVIAANPDTSPDSDFLYQVRIIWPDLMAIG